MKNLFFLSIIALPLFGFAQQLSPTEMVAQPRDHKFAVSGIGGGNLYETKSKTGSSSGQMSIDWNMFSTDKTTRSGKDKTVTVGTIFRYNPVISTRLLEKDSLVAKKLPFVDNEYLIHFGMRSRGLRAMGDGGYYDSYSDEGGTNMLLGSFFDVMYTPYSVQIDTGSAKFQTVNLHTGFHWGFYNANSPIGAIGFSFSPQVDFLKLLEDPTDPNGFERSMKSNINLPGNIFGTGGKFVFQINDFAVFFECREYWPINSAENIPGLTRQPIISFGGLATGTAFRNNAND